MRLYEHEAKTVLADAGIHVPRRLALLHTPDDPCNASINAGAMVKAQTLIGGRGKVGGIRRVQLAAELRAAAREILSMRIHGYPVQSVLVEEALESSAACYLGVTLNPATFHNVIIASTAGGVDIEEAARVRPESILRLELADSPAALDPADARKVAAFLAAGLQNLSGVENREALVAALADVTAKLYAAYQTHDAKVLEINPLLITSSGPVAADAKMVLDDNALFRQTDLLAKLGIEGKRHEDAESTGANAAPPQAVSPSSTCCPRISSASRARSMWASSPAGQAMASSRSTKSPASASGSSMAGSCRSISWTPAAARRCKASPKCSRS